MPASVLSVQNNSSRISEAMVEKADQWVFSKEIPTDVVVVVGEAKFSLHKFILVAKSNYLRKVIVDSKEEDLDRIDLSGIPGGPEIFEKAAKFCYGVNFEITVENVAGLRCAAEYLQMTENYCNESLGRRTEEFLLQVAFTSLPAAVAVLKSCQYLLPLAEELNIVQRCVGAASALACNEARLASRSPPDWWTEEFSNLDIPFLEKIVSAMRARGAEPLSIARTLVTYSERQKLLLEVVGGHGDDRPDTPEGTINIHRSQQLKLVESMVDLLPSVTDLENMAPALPINRFLCRLLRSALLLKAGSRCRMELEKRISATLEHVTVEDLLLLSFKNSRREKLLLDNLESVTRIVSGFVAEYQPNPTTAVAVSNKEQVCRDFTISDKDNIRRNPQRSSSVTILQRVSKTVDAYLGEIAKDAQLSISMFNGIAILLAKGAREVDDDLYRAIDIFLKTHSSLDEIDREKVCSVMDPLRLSYDARIHASHNKRLPVQVVLHALYFDQLKLRSRGNTIDDTPRIKSTPKQSNHHQLQTDVTLIRENEALRSELAKMKLYISDLQGKNARHPIEAAAATPSAVASTHNKNDPKPPSRKATFFSSMSKTLGKLNPFRHGSKDTSTRVEDDSDIVIKPRRRRFSIS